MLLVYLLMIMLDGQALGALQRLQRTLGQFIRIHRQTSFIISLLPFTRSYAGKTGGVLALSPFEC